MSAPRHGYAYIWEYRIRPGAAEAFEAAYGPDGRWVELFRAAPGYVGTALHRDRHAAERYVTVDYWRSRADWEAFRSASAGAYEAIDAACDALTVEEHEIGQFTPVD